MSEEKKDRKKIEKCEKCEKCKNAYCNRCKNGIGTLRDSCKRCKQVKCDEKSVEERENPCNPSYGYRDITPTLAIGTMIASDKDFDVIIDLDFPSNGAKEDMIDVIMTKEGKIFFLVGMKVKDHIFNNKDAMRYNGELMYDLLQSIIPLLLNLYHFNSSYRFLFKCFGGFHRSLALATAFFCLSRGISLERGYALIDSIMKPVVSIKNKKIGTYYEVVEFYLRSVSTSRSISS